MMNDTAKAIILDFYKLAGRGYERAWWKNCHCRVRCFKGSRNSKKSYNIGGLEPLDKIIEDPCRNILFIREENTANRISTFAVIRKLINTPDPSRPWLSLSGYFSIKNNDMTIVYKPTGQQIIFRGMDDPDKITSISFPIGFFTDIYVEEAFQIKDYEAWRKIDGSLRGKLPEGSFHQITFMFNAWSNDTWLYDHYFKGRLEDDFNFLDTHPYQDWCNPDMIIDFGKGLYLHTSTFRVNEFRDKEIYDIAMADLKEKSIDLYKVEALGMWGKVSETTYPEFNMSLVKPMQTFMRQRYYSYSVGIDFGISDGQGHIIRGKGASMRLGSATTMQLVGVTDDYSKLDCIDEWFFSNENQAVKKTGPEMQKELVETLKKWRDETYYSHPDLMKGTILVYVDCADSGGFRQGLELEARRQHLYNVRFIASTKLMIESRVYFTRQLMAYEDYRISEKCENLIREIKNARMADNGRVREDTDDHAINANEYAWAPIAPMLKSWKTFKTKG